MHLYYYVVNNHMYYSIAALGGVGVGSLFVYTCNFSFLFVCMLSVLHEVYYYYYG